MGPAKASRAAQKARGAAIAPANDTITSDFMYMMQDTISRLTSRIGLSRLYEIFSLAERHLSLIRAMSWQAWILEKIRNF